LTPQDDSTSDQAFVSLLRSSGSGATFSKKTGPRKRPHQNLRWTFLSARPGWADQAIFTSDAHARTVHPRTEWKWALFRSNAAATAAHQPFLQERPPPNRGLVRPTPFWRAKMGEERTSYFHVSYPWE